MELNFFLRKDFLIKKVYYFVCNPYTDPQILNIIMPKL